ncbi:MAG TPA: hypothetical protein VGE07_27065 [Herpetosiphonaceae bacterium]
MRWLARVTIGLLLALGLAAVAQAHGGDLVLQHREGDYELVALLGPSPYRVGRADLSLLLRDMRTQQPVRGARILLTLDDPADGQPAAQFEARLEGDPRLSVYGSHQIDFTHAGDWQLRIIAVAPGVQIDQTAAVTVQSDLIRWLEIGLYSLPVLAFAGLIIAKRRHTRRIAAAGAAQGE